nr:MAG TPA: hypothetical protein [Caudoviricetes sp.]
MSTVPGFHKHTRFSIRIKHRRSVFLSPPSFPLHDFYI